MMKFFCDGCESEVIPGALKDEIVIQVKFIQGRPETGPERIFCDDECLARWVEGLR